eukprot:NODE_7574_length_432_cov_224.204244.p3 GENE.NODE_7574_length_432_cov_224.204244~~NODE_7574_length_432_cov_224.204244.p3  ORF type:complete len:84 (-),score=10.39 NODE_7574_length_432_cov_224.204244:51-302(-)
MDSLVHARDFGCLLALKMSLDWAKRRLRHLRVALGRRGRGRRQGLREVAHSHATTTLAAACAPPVIAAAAATIACRRPRSLAP